MDRKKSGTSKSDEIYIIQGNKVYYLQFCFPKQHMSVMDWNFYGTILGVK